MGVGEEDIGAGIEVGIGAFAKPIAEIGEKRVDIIEQMKLADYSPDSQGVYIGYVWHVDFLRNSGSDHPVNRENLRS